VASEPNALQNSNIGIKGNEEFAPGWTFVFDLESGFDPLLLAILQRTGFRGVSVSALLAPILFT
jgi:hypothetical protein